MSFHLEINPRYTTIEPSLKAIKTVFSEGHHTIHKARNEIKIIAIDNLSCVIKSFKIPHLINRLVYAYFRKSKAYKSYHNAIKLIQMEITTPDPIGYIEFFKFGLFDESYFISEHIEYDLTMADVRDNPPEDAENILIALAKFTYSIHQKGVWHSDYSGGNILIKRQDREYKFYLVDINRMKFITIQGYSGLKNFNKMWLNTNNLTTIAEEYARCANLDQATAIEQILHHDSELKANVEQKRRWKKFFSKR